MVNRLAMAVLCWMVFIPLVSVPLASSAAIDQAASKKGIFIAIASADPPNTTVGLQSATDENQAPPAVIECYCNLEKCGASMHCTTGYGCFSELQPVMSGVDNDTVPSTTVAPTMSQDFDDDATTFVFSNHTSNGSFGCLDMLSVNKTCDHILKSMEGDDSEFPTLPHQGTQDNVVRAFHCCQENMCNDPSRVAAKTVQESLAAVIRNSMSESNGEQPAVAAPAEPLPPADLHTVYNAETVQAEAVPENSTTTVKPASADLASSVQPSATDVPATDVAATTADSAGDEHATPAPATAGPVDHDPKTVSASDAAVANGTVAAPASTEHVPATSAVPANSSTDHPITEAPAAVTAADSSGNVTAQSVTVNATVAGNDSAKNLTSETTAPVAVAETSTAEIATTANGSAERKTPLADAGDAVRVVLTDDKVGANVNDTAAIHSDVAPQHDGDAHAETSALKSHLPEPLEVDNDNWRLGFFIGLDPTGIYVGVCIAFGLIVAMFKVYKRSAGVSGTYKGVCNNPEEPCACGQASAKTAATALYGIGTCAGCVGSSEYAYTAIPVPARH